MRIKNQYLISILSLVTTLGSRNVSCLLMTEAWRDRGRTCDDIFFMHFDVLFNYEFLEKNRMQENVLGMEVLLKSDQPLDYQFSITEAGREFLHRYG